MNVTLILAGAVAIMVLMGASSYKAYRLGGDSVRAEVAVERDKAIAKAEADRQADADKARKLAGNLQAALTKQKGLSHDLGNALEAHIKAIPAPPAGCPEPRLPDSLLNDWNAANHATANPAGRGLLIPSGTLTAPLGAVLGSGNAEPR